MRVLLTGATGFTGSHVLPLLLETGLQVRCFVRNPEKLGSPGAGVEMAVGDLADADSLRRAASGCDALVNIASLGFGHAPGIVHAAEQAGVKRTVFIGTTAIFTQLNAPSKAVRVAAEETVRRSSLHWTILRPTMIYGTARDRNICRLIRFVRRSPVLPVFGSGECLMQPIHVDDLAAGIVAALTVGKTVGKTYNLAGKQAAPYREIVQTVARLMGKRIRLLRIPYRPAVRLLQAAERLGLRLPVKGEQVLRLNEDKAFSWEEAAGDFGFAPRCFEEGARAELRSMNIPVRPGSSA